MLVLVVSDIHGNRTALEAVLEDARHFEHEAVWCLGDIVGYGPEPNECVDYMRQMNAVCVIGNHDWAVLGGMDIEDFNTEARRAVLWTREQLSSENFTWLRGRTNEPIVFDAFTLTHGSPRDPVWEYILYPSTARANFDYFATPYCLVGHTHVPALYTWTDTDTAVRALIPAPGETIHLQELCGPGCSARAIMNPGSVGQPRDNDPRAAYAILDTEALTWLPRRIGYPIEITQNHMRQAGLPERLINRLAYGW